MMRMLPPSLVIKDLSWPVLPGERIAFTGNNGTGKSTLLSPSFGDNPKSYANHIYLFDRKGVAAKAFGQLKKILVLFPLHYICILMGAARFLKLFSPAFTIVNSDREK